MNERWIVICRWDEFQHREAGRGTEMTWVRNWCRLLHDDAYLDLSAHQRAVLHGLWMLYASSRCQVAVNTASLSRQLNLRVSSRQLESLSDAGFIEIVARNPARTEQTAVLSVSSKAAGLNSGVSAAAHKQTSGNRLKPDLLEQLLQLKGVDERTPKVLAGFARRGLPEAAFRNALEATHDAGDRLRGTQIGYLVGTLRELEKKGQYR